MLVRLNHVTLPAEVLAESIGFYQALGLELIVLAAPRYARFAVDDGSTLSVEVTEDGRAGSAEIFLHCESVDADVAAAEARGLSFDWPPTDQSYLWRTAGLRDPAGNRIILFTPGGNQHFPPWRLDGRRGQATG
jgi:catechol 2,3-dioxygenase-like lactoylglutathione lyase family enzyme